MLACTSGAVLCGVDATLVWVECDISNGLPSFAIVGLPDASVSEARERVRAAILHSGFDYPRERITVNLAPSDVRKQGPWLDLPLALGLLGAQGSIPLAGVSGRLFVGELGLSGEVRPIRGALAAAEAARRSGIREVVCPAANAAEASLAGLPAVGVGSLAEAIDVVKGAGSAAVEGDPHAWLAVSSSGGPDMSQIREQDAAKRALEIAAAGGHNVLMSGPPGTGKTLLARALPGILPRMTVDEALEVTRIHSASGLLPPGEPLVRARPFRSPHHGVSQAGMIGGGSSWIRPGEVTLAHRGILFLDEFPEFPRWVLEALRQPLEDGRVTVTRSRHAATYPARFQLVAAMNPCPCGHRGTDTPCRCTPYAVDAYERRLSGPLLDRIDLHVQVPRVDAGGLLSDGDGESSEEIRRRVEAAREIGADRGRPLGATSNAELSPGLLLPASRLDREAKRMLAKAAHRQRLSARAVHRLVRVGRTIADLGGRDVVEAVHIGEALLFRLNDGARPPSSTRATGA